jgi:hypothetical protein
VTSVQAQSLKNTETASSGDRATDGARRRVGYLAIAVVLGAAILGCGSSGATSNAETTPTNASPDPTETTVDPELGVKPDFGPPASCGEVDVDVVTRALGTDAKFLGVDPSGCGFTAGQWILGVRVDPYDPDATGALKTSPSLSGTSVPNQTFLTNDRSGRWQVRSTLIVKEKLYTFQLVNTASGSDTYPPTEGEPLRPVTEVTALRLIEAIAATSR